jgi:hypothetical protein
MKVVKTKLSVLDINQFQNFLNHHEIRGVFIGIHSVRKNYYQIDNLIQYVYDDDNDTMAAIVSLTLKHGSLEKAFLKVRYSDKEIEEMFS